MHLNIRSLKYKTLELEVLLASVDPTIVVLTEHWLSYAEISHVNLNNYTLASSFCRRTAVGGGVCIFVKNGLTFSSPVAHSAAMDFHCEYTLTEVILDNVSVQILGIYRSPNSDTNIFFNTFNSLLDNLCSLNKKVLVCCDFNIDYLLTMY